MGESHYSTSVDWLSETQQTNWRMESFLHSFVRSFIRSFIHSITHSQISYLVNLFQWLTYLLYEWNFTFTFFCLFQPLITVANNGLLLLIVIFYFRLILLILSDYFVFVFRLFNWIIFNYFYLFFALFLFYIKMIFTNKQNQEKTLSTK